MYFFAQSLYYLAKLKKKCIFSTLLDTPKVPKKDKKKGGNPLFMGFATLIICYLINSLKLFLEAWNLITGNHILVVEEILHET